MSDEAIATVHWYRVGLTRELTRDEEAELGSNLHVMAQRTGDRLTCGVVWGKTDEQEITDFSSIVSRGGFTNG